MFEPSETIIGLLIICLNTFALMVKKEKTMFLTVLVSFILLGIVGLLRLK